jgi:Arylsulfotransferase (ASST)
MSEELTRRHVFGLAGASVAGAAGLGLSACSTSSAAVQAIQTASSTSGPPFKSRPDLTPPSITIRHPGAVKADPRYIFLNAPYSGPGHGGSYIIDTNGHFVWFGPNTATHHRMNFSAQTYQGQPVLTWFEGVLVGGFGQGELVIADSSYKIRHIIRAHGTQLADFHEFVVTAHGTALITIYRRHANVDLRAVGGSANGYLVSGVCQEIDIATGNLVFEWDSWAPTNPPVPLRETYQKIGVGDGGHGTKASPYNYFHINSIAEVDPTNPTSDLLISGRNTFTVYQVKRPSGQIRWRIGGKKSNFTMGPRSQYHWQHHVRLVPSNNQQIMMMTVFDNGVPNEPHSRAEVLAVDTGTKRVELKKAFIHPGLPQYQSGAMGSAQLLRDGRMFVGWGTEPHFSEFAPDGSLLLDGDIVKGDPSYRGFTQNWAGQPDPSVELPACAARPRSGGATVYASWNGATKVRWWVVYAGRTRGTLHKITKTGKNGFETAIAVSNRGPYFMVQALDGKGRALAKSRIVKIA